jgi:hypothetical protein
MKHGWLPGFAWTFPPKTGDWIQEAVEDTERMIRPHHPTKRRSENIRRRRRGFGSTLLRKRLVTFPSLISGRSIVIDDKAPPLSKLFGECKERRGSFVHCEPGPDPTKWGYAKETHFHDVDPVVARETVHLTLETISLIWQQVHNKEKPSRLPSRGKDGRFERVNVVLRPLDSVEEFPFKFPS